MARAEAGGLPWLRLLWRLFWPERARLATFTLCFAFGVGALFSVGNLLSMVDRALYERARELLGADLSLSATRPLSESLSTLAERSPQLAGQLRGWTREGGRLAETVELASMAAPLTDGGEGTPFLVALKGADQSYPLHGAMTLSPGSQGLGSARCSVRATERTCFPALMSSAGAAIRGVTLGDRLQVGAVDLELVGLIEREPAGGSVARSPSRRGF